MTAVKDKNKQIERMFHAGAHFGYSKSRRHPSVSEFIFGTKNRVEILDLEKTNELLQEAKAFVEKLGQEKKTLLFVGSKNEGRDVIKNTAISLDMPYVSGRWIGGTITNFPQIKKRIERLEELSEQREKGELSKYTKKERLLIDREIEKLETNFLGLLPIKEKLPDALFVVDVKHENIAVTEARKAGIPVVSVSNSDCDMTGVNYPIVANDATLGSIKFFTDEIAEAYREGLKKEEVTKS
jgi:small subunit ribosomal protein S2|tara:strand:- start:41435 stop:42154 length:720 start_codon:yes stop_codon:yes gene_type:complete